MVHQPSGGASGQATDIQIQAEEIIKLKRQLNEIYVKHTGQDLSFIEQNMERDKFMSPAQARDFLHHTSATLLSNKSVPRSRRRCKYEWSFSAGPIQREEGTAQRLQELS